MNEISGYMQNQSGYNPQIHNRRSMRLKGYDYSQPGLYFITICCQDKICRFGKIENDEMILNEFGKIAHDEWEKTPQIRPNVQLGEFVIMPNHIHGIIHLDNRRGVLQTPPDLQTPHDMQMPQDLQTSHDMNILNADVHMGVCKTPIHSPSQTVGAIVRGFKSSVTKQWVAMGFTGKLWQRNYYEHIIRNEQSYHAISQYILNNPLKWNNDTFFRNVP